MWLSKEEILSWSLMGVQGLLVIPISDQERISPYSIKQISDGNKKYINYGIFSLFIPNSPK